MAICPAPVVWPAGRKQTIWISFAPAIIGTQIWPSLRCAIAGSMLTKALPTWRTKSIPFRNADPWSGTKKPKPLAGLSQEHCPFLSTAAKSAVICAPEKIPRRYVPFVKPAKSVSNAFCDAFNRSLAYSLSPAAVCRPRTPVRRRTGDRVLPALWRDAKRYPGRDDQQQADVAWPPTGRERDKKEAVDEPLLFR